MKQIVFWIDRKPREKMKFMKLGTRPDTFYTEEAIRSIVSDIPSDLTVQINNITYLLHKFPLVPKCGLLQRLCLDTEDSENVTLDLHDIPGGEDAFELCAKFCYGITINLSAHNFVPALSAAKFLRMTESVERGNFVPKLEAFFSSCILQGWKDSIVTLHTTARLPEWSESLGIVRKCIDSIVEKILTPPTKVGWSYTYTRPGYREKKHHQAVPKDWWTEDIADLDIDLFRYIITTVKSTNMLLPQLIGEALHVYVCRWLPDVVKIRAPETSVSQSDESMEKKRRVLETIVSMIPKDRGSVSVGFLLRLLSMAGFFRVSTMIKTELVKRCSLQFEEATVDDLLLPLHSSDDLYLYDIDLVGVVLESFLTRWRRQQFVEHSQLVMVMRNVGKLLDSYLQIIARDVNMPVQKVVSLAKALPEIARSNHDDLYKAINIYLKEHPEVSKTEKKLLCRVLDCQKMSQEMCAHAVRNERLPLRTVVQLLFFEQERSVVRPTASQKLEVDSEFDVSRQQTPDELRRSQSSKGEGTTSKTPVSTGKGRYRSSQKLESANEPESTRKEIVEEIVEGSRLGSKKIALQRRSKSEHDHYKDRERWHKM